MRTKIPPIPGFAKDYPLVECPHVSLEWNAVPRCEICGYKSEPQFGCIPRIEQHLKEAHGIVAPEGRYWWIDCSRPGEEAKP